MYPYLDTSFCLQVATIPTSNNPLNTASVSMPSEVFVGHIFTECGENNDKWTHPA